MKKYTTKDILDAKLIEGVNKQIEDYKHTVDFYKSRIDELNSHKHEFPEPYLTMICNIIANGKIRP